MTCYVVNVHYCSISQNDINSRNEITSRIALIEGVKATFGQKYINKPEINMIKNLIINIRNNV